MAPAVRSLSFAATLAAALAAFAVMFAGCKDKPQAGSLCTTSFVCSDKLTALYCTAGTYQPIACRGPRGCSGEGTSSTCDMQTAEEGDVCIGSVDSYACSTDRKQGLSCRDGKWSLWRTCKGQSGCVWKSKSSVDCDSTTADLADSCGVAGSVACSSDKKTLLICRSDKFQLYKSCRGPNGCTVKSTASTTSAQQKIADCDNSTGMEGDACDVQEDRICSVDRESVLVCRGAKYVKDKDCKRPGGCLFVSHQSPPKCDF